LILFLEDSFTLQANIEAYLKIPIPIAFLIFTTFMIDVAID